PARYLAQAESFEDGDTSQHIDDGTLSFAMGAAPKRQQWLADAKQALDAHAAEAVQAERAGAMAETQARQQAASGVIDRFSSGTLGRFDILDSGLSPDAQQQAIAMMARGPLAAGNDALHGQLFMKAVDGDLRDKSELLPHLAQADGVSPAQA